MEAGRPIAISSFKNHFYRQPILTEGPLYPEPYRKVTVTGVMSEVPSTAINSLEEGQGGLGRNEGELATTFSPLHTTSPSTHNKFTAVQTVDIDAADVSHEGISNSSNKVAAGTSSIASKDMIVNSDVPNPITQLESKMCDIEIDFDRVDDEVEDPPEVLETYFRDYVLPLTHPDYVPPAVGPNSRTSQRRRGSIF